MVTYLVVLFLVCIVNVRPEDPRDGRSLAFVSGGPASQQIISQKLGPAGALHLETVQNLDYIDCPCGCNVTTYRGIAKNQHFSRDDRCGTGINGNMLMGIKVVCSCGCEVIFPGGTNVTFYVDDMQCNRTASGSIDGATIACSNCGCTGTIPTNGIAYRFGRSPLCLANGGNPGQTVIVSNSGGNSFGGFGNSLGFGSSSFNGNPYTGVGGAYPAIGGYGYPQVGGYGYPQVGGFGYPQVGGFGYPQGYGIGAPQGGFPFNPVGNGAILG